MLNAGGVWGGLLENHQPLCAPRFFEFETQLEVPNVVSHSQLGNLVGEFSSEGES